MFKQSSRILSRPADDNGMVKVWQSARAGIQLLSLSDGLWSRLFSICHSPSSTSIAGWKVWPWMWATAKTANACWSYGSDWHNMFFYVFLMTDIRIPAVRRRIQAGAANCDECTTTKARQKVHGTHGVVKSCFPLLRKQTGAAPPKVDKFVSKSHCQLCKMDSRRGHWSGASLKTQSPSPTSGPLPELMY